MHYIFAEEREGMIAIDIWKGNKKTCVRGRYKIESRASPDTISGVSLIQGQ